MNAKYETLEDEHIGKRFVRLFGHVRMVADFIGTILPSDVGKRVYLIDGILQVENDDQLAQRLAAPSDTLELMLEMPETHSLSEKEIFALRRAKQALDILATLEAGLHLREPITLEKCNETKWAATRAWRTHAGVSVADALGQLCQTLALENE